MLFLCRADVEDVGPIVEQHWVKLRICCDKCSRRCHSVEGVLASPPRSPTSLSAAVTCVILRNIAIRPWL